MSDATDDLWTGRAQQRRDRRIRAAIVVAVAVGLVVALALGRSARQPQAEAVGDDPVSTSTRDTSPFEMAGPRETSALTTIPDPDRFEDDEDEAPEITASTIPPTTDTLPRPSTPEVPALDSITSLCGVTASIRSLYSITQSDQFDEEAVVNQLRNNLRRYAVLDPEAGALITAIADDVDRLAFILSQNGFDGRSPAILEAVQAIDREVEPFPDLGERIFDLSLIESDACR